MLRQKPRAWTEDEDRKLLEMKAAGRSSISIANALKRTTSAVTARITAIRRSNEDREKKDPPRSWTAEEDSLLLKLKAEGPTVSAIAKHFDRTEVAVSDRLAILRKRLLVE